MENKILSGRELKLALFLAKDSIDDFKNPIASDVKLPTALLFDDTLTALQILINAKIIKDCDNNTYRIVNFDELIEYFKNMKVEHYDALRSIAFANKSGQRVKLSLNELRNVAEPWYHLINHDQLVHFVDSKTKNKAGYELTNLGWAVFALNETELKYLLTDVVTVALKRIYSETMSAELSGAEVKPTFSLRVFTECAVSTETVSNLVAHGILNQYQTERGVRYELTQRGEAIGEQLTRQELFDEIEQDLIDAVNEQQLPYPCLVQHENNMIVLAISETSGTVVQEADPSLTDEGEFVLPIGAFQTLFHPFTDPSVWKRVSEVTLNL